MAPWGARSLVVLFQELVLELRPIGFLVAHPTGVGKDVVVLAAPVAPPAHATRNVPTLVKRLWLSVLGEPGMPVLQIEHIPEWLHVAPRIAPAAPVVVLLDGEHDFLQERLHPDIPERIPEELRYFAGRMAVGRAAECAENGYAAPGRHRGLHNRVHLGAHALPLEVVLIAA
eukprot:11265199-Alexandrium_andersonii.AAC.1